MSNNRPYYIEDEQEYKEFQEWKRIKAKQRRPDPRTIPMTKISIQNMAEIVTSHIGVGGSFFGDAIEEEIEKAVVYYISKLDELVRSKILKAIESRIDSELLVNPKVLELINQIESVVGSVNRDTEDNE